MNGYRGRVANPLRPADLIPWLMKQRFEQVPADVVAHALWENHVALGTVRVALGSPSPSEDPPGDWNRGVASLLREARESGTSPLTANS